ncbi:rhamnulokinase [Alkalicoccobacillus murimartini]|uniref:Rhamnulokinase n=1 Tax=Alkalicoccobacillus murimartini TaxID=171685 RepID=A0ABT9YH97_9BACI|nr:rhamnulokinase [Alkalicoccobacillus murimartini]MDQ0207235.1 rhamnulokinase [Alkalicoccobacillus murimartini]
MASNHIAVDIGASGGRLLVGRLIDEKIDLQEVHRFSNGMINKSGQLCWDIDYLFDEIKKGILACRDQGITPTSIGIDTWAVDFVLLDAHDQLLTPAVAYRDTRTDGVMEEVTQQIRKEKIYSYTGIQFQPFNTIYQLAALKKEQPEALEKAESFLMIPDYFHYLLTGKKVNEYTNATSTQLMNAFTKEWDPILLEGIGMSPDVFEDIVLPGTHLGGLKQELVDEFGFDLEVIVPATHDTASAVAAVPESKETIYLSSGTWSLLGVENSEPICSEKALSYNFTNEGGVNHRFRFLKNIMGFWMIQEVKRLYGDLYSFDDLVQASKQVKNPARIDVDQHRFLNPVNMIEEIQAACMETGQPVPAKSSELAACVFHSLTQSYQTSIQQIEEVVGQPFDQVNIIGGGAQNEYVNQLLANQTGKRVVAGPIEATAIGNIIVQMIAQNEISHLSEARELVAKSFDLTEYIPQKGEIHHG